jgi:hypothetical protein
MNPKIKISIIIILHFLSIQKNQKRTIKKKIEAFGPIVTSLFWVAEIKLQNSKCHSI